MLDKSGEHFSGTDLMRGILDEVNSAETFVGWSLFEFMLLQCDQSKCLLLLQDPN